MLLILLGFQFGSQKAATVAIFPIALAASWALILLMITHTSLDGTAVLGILLVFVIAVNNVILIFARARQLDGNHPKAASVAFAARQRQRPILMTNAGRCFRLSAPRHRHRARNRPAAAPGHLSHGWTDTENGDELMVGPGAVCRMDGEKTKNS